MDQALLAAVATATAASTASDTATSVSEPKRQAAETRRLYAADWAAFAAWGRARQLSVLPTQSETVAVYLASLSAALSYGALARRVAAIVDRHRRDNVPLPATDGAVRAVLRTARNARRIGLASSTGDQKRAPTRRAAPPGAVQLLRMAARCPGDLAGLRDRALLLLSAGGLGGERLLALDREHVRFTAHGMELAVPGIRVGRGTMIEPVPAAPRDGAGQADPAAEVVVVPETMPAPVDAAFVMVRLAAVAACPVRALERWLEHSETRFGPVFRKVNRWNGIEHARLRPDALPRIWQRRAEALREISAQRRSHRSADAAK